MDIPLSTDGEYRRKDTGFGVWGLQRGLNELGRNLVEDGIFGARTENVVKDFQASHAIGADGVVGEVTTGHIVADLEDNEISAKLPNRILEGFAWGEGGMDFGAVNWTVPGGVDCGTYQRRVFSSDFDNEAVKQRAFDPLYQMKLLTNTLVFWANKFWTTPNAVKTKERAWRLAALHWNYPSGAEHLAVTPESQLSSYWTSPASWVPGVFFDDRTLVRTPLDWCDFYALGAPEHEERGLVTVLCDTWPTPQP